MPRSHSVQREHHPVAPPLFAHPLQKQPRAWASCSPFSLTRSLAQCGASAGCTIFKFLVRAPEIFSWNSSTTLVALVQHPRFKLFLPLAWLLNLDTHMLGILTNEKYLTRRISGGQPPIRRRHCPCIASRVVARLPAVTSISAVVAVFQASAEYKAHPGCRASTE